MPGTPGKTATPKATSPEVGTSSLGSTPDLGFHIGELTPEASPAKEESEGPYLPRLKCGRGTPGLQMPKSTSPMGKHTKEPVGKRHIPNPVKEPIEWLNYIKTEHPVE